MRKSHYCAIICILVTGFLVHPLHAVASPTISKQEAKAIRQLSTSLKRQIEQKEAASNATQARLQKIEDEQKILNHDISQVQVELNTALQKEIEALKAENQEKEFWMWTGIISAGLLGIIIN